jgi:hypothetical protein
MQPRTGTPGSRGSGDGLAGHEPGSGDPVHRLDDADPDAGYAEVLETLLGDLVLVPWQRPCQVPTAAVACTWREALGPAPPERLRDVMLAGVDGEYRSRDYRTATVGDLEVGSIDGH